MESSKYLVLKNNNDTELNETGDLKLKNCENETTADDEPGCLLFRNVTTQKTGTPKAAGKSQLKVKFNFKRSKVSQNQRKSKIEQGNKNQSIKSSSVMSCVLHKTKKLNSPRFEATKKNVSCGNTSDTPKKLVQPNLKKVYSKGTNATETKPAKNQSRNILTGNNTPEKNWAISSESPTILKIKRVQSPESNLKPDGSQLKKLKPTSFNCLFCYDVYPELHELDQHCRDVHLPSIRAEYFKEKPAVHSCLICGKKFGFLFKKAFDQHVAAHSQRVDPPAIDFDCKIDGGEEHRNNIDKKSKTNVDSESAENNNRFDELPLVCEGPIEIPRATLMSLPCVAADLTASDEFLVDSSQMDDYQRVLSSSTAGVKMDFNLNSVAHTSSSGLSLTTPAQSPLKPEVYPSETCYPSPAMLFPNFLSNTTPVKFSSTPKKTDKIFTPAKAGMKILGDHMIDKIPRKPHFTPEKVGERPPQTLLSYVVGQNTPVKTNVTPRQVGKKCSGVAIPMTNLTPAKIRKTSSTLCPDIVNLTPPAKTSSKSPRISGSDKVNDKTPLTDESTPRKSEDSCPLPTELFLLNSTPDKIDKSKKDPISTEAVQPSKVATLDQKRTKVYNSQVNSSKTATAVEMLEKIVASSAEPDHIGLVNPQNYPIPGLTFSKFYVWQHSTVSVSMDKTNYKESGQLLKMGREDINKDLNINFSSDNNFKDQDSNSGLQDKGLSSKTSKDDSASEETSSANNRVTCSPVENRNTVHTNFTSDYKSNRNESSSTSGDTSSCITEDKSTSEGTNTTISRYFSEKQNIQSQVIRVPEVKCATLQTRCVSNVEIDTTEDCSTLGEKSSKGKHSSTNEYNNATDGEICSSENEGSDNKISYFEEDNSVIESSYTEDNERDFYAPEDKCATKQASSASVDKSLLKVVQCRSLTTTPSSIPEFESSTARSTTELTIIPSEDKSPVNEASYTLQNKSPVNEASYTLQNKSPVNEASCTLQNKIPVNEANCTLQNKSPVNEANCTLQNKSPVNEASCTLQNKSPVNEASCTLQNKSPVNEASCTLQNKSPVNETSCTLQNKSPVNEASCTLQNKSPVNEVNCTLQNKSPAYSTLNAKRTLNETNHTLADRSSTVEVSCDSQERSGTNLSCCVTEDVQSSPLICTTEEKRAIIQSSCISEINNSSVHISIPEDNCVNLDSKGTVSDATCTLEDDSADKEANYVSKNSRIINAAPEYKSVVYEAIFALVNKSASKKTNYSEGKKITNIETRFTSEDSSTTTETRFTSEDSSTANETSCALGDVILQNNHHVEVHKNAKPHPKEKDSLHQFERKTIKCIISQPFPNYSLRGADVVKPPAAVLKFPATGVKPPAAGVKFPATGVKPPAAGVKFPATGVKPPAAGVKFPATGVKPPAAGVKFPATGVKPPAAVVKPPAVGVKPPAAGVKFPATGVKPPDAVVKPPAAGVKPPAAVVKPPAASVEPPAAGVEPPAAGLKPPATGVKPPLVGLKPPAAVVKPEPVKMLAPYFVRKGSATPRPVTGCFSCKLCGITTTGNVNLKMHLQGAKHKKKLSQEIQKRRSEGVQNS